MISLVGWPKLLLLFAQSTLAAHSSLVAHQGITRAVGKVEPQRSFNMAVKAMEVHSYTHV